MSPCHSDLDYAGERLRLVGSRVVKHGKLKESAGEQQGDDAEGLLHRRTPRDTPQFAKLFYDLWFVANLNVFASVHDITGKIKLVSFVGYIVLLWTTWLMTTIYDVRFTADSVLERCCKAIHLGVMVGFAEIGTSFNPEAQIKAVFQALSLFLMVSRLILALQYGIVAFQVRKYVDGGKPLLVTAALHFAAAMVYLGTMFRYEEGRNSRVFVVWYVVGVVEMAVHLGCSQLTDVLTFVGSHLGERLNLLTLIILGEGVIILAKNVMLLVKDTYVKQASSSMWSSSLIGSVASSTALTYFIFQLYFDWMHKEESMSVRHQVWWASLHLPFHIALVLFLEGANQFIIWARVLESVAAATSKIRNARHSLVQAKPKSIDVSKALGDIMYPFLRKYQPEEVLETYTHVKETLTNIGEIPDSFWIVDESESEDGPMAMRWKRGLEELFKHMVDCIYNAFDIEAPEKDQEDSSGGETGLYSPEETTQAITSRFRLVFIYAFACAGIVLLFLTVMHIISKRKGWSPFNIIRTAICIVISVGLALVTTLATNADRPAGFIGSPWMLPTITLSYFAVLLLSHLPHPPVYTSGTRVKAMYMEVEKH
ncbi:uncharacterized protein BCR38DRAFT_461007 [Pseudomassariella vexata]|uniref:Bacterial low temperature requirement A protein-domain-containing protein n=1 Tax=Pseudomassariella vexata TaxID=1141098 RepID=A0A1Y2DGK7_9PEZI|nr:uncharacterized protein BCR38DRAFT_461007 [Pseudomassariella vexata]ORY58214.1 hypothetical protein BCR38DRAFT_461007 [Pseudomassariella vexata]